MSAPSSIVATSRTKTAPWAVRRSGTASRSLMLVTIAFIATIGYLSPRFMLPEGLIVLPCDRACTMSSGERP